MKLLLFVFLSELKISELAIIAEKIASDCRLDIDQVSKVFLGDDSLKKGTLDATLLMEIFISWKKKNRAIQEPRHIFARKLLDLASDQASDEVTKKMKELASEIDPYY